MERTNETWVQQLGEKGSVQNEALSDLRHMVIAGLRRALQGRAGIDDAFLEDIAQEALVKTLEHLQQFQGRSRFTTWATSIAIRVAFTELRRRRWKDVSLEQVLENTGRVPEQAIDANPGPDTNIQRESLVEKMYQIINTELTDKQRSALLAELAGMPQEEIGRHMQTNRNAIYKLTHDARKKLRQTLETAGYTAADVHTAFGN